MTVKDLGFLSPEFAKHINVFRREHSSWFCLSDRLNQLGQTALTSTHAPRENNQKLLVAVLLIRLVSAFQATIILAERGMTIEARYVLRSMLELVFALAAAAREPEFPRKYALNATRHQKTTANVLLRLPDDYKPAKEAVSGGNGAGYPLTPSSQPPCPVPGRTRAGCW